MTIDEEALSVIIGNGSFCNADKLMIRGIVEAYEQAKKPSPANTALVKKLVEAISYAIWQHEGGGTPEHNHWTGVCRTAITEANAYLERISHEK